MGPSLTNFVTFYRLGLVKSQVLETCYCNFDTWWRNMRKFQRFSSTKEQQLQNIFTLSHLSTWKNVNNDIFQNSQTDWLANCLAGSLQLANTSIRNSQSRIFTLLHGIIIMFSRSFSKFLFSSTNFLKLRCHIRGKTVLYHNGYCYLDIFQ